MLWGHLRWTTFSPSGVKLIMLHCGLIQIFKLFCYARLLMRESHWHCSGRLIPHYFGWRTSGTSGPVTCRTLPVPQLSVRSCWNRNPEGTPHLDSFPWLVCRPTWEGPVVWHTEPSTCASYLLAETIERRLLFRGHEEKLQHMTQRVIEFL